MERSKIAPKLGVVFVDKDRKNAKPTNDSYDIEIGLDKIKLRKRDCLMRKETQQKNNSLK